MEIKKWLKGKAETICSKLEKSILSNKTLKCKVVFGPVHSRRLGNVLGINNIKQKACPYNCIYCPTGKTSCCSICTNYCLSPYELHLSVSKKLEELKNKNKKIDFIAFAGSGEPTLDSALSKEISLIRKFGYKIAVFTNTSMLWNPNIQENLLYADYVSVKIDTVNENTWSEINRPHKRLEYATILNGIIEFSEKFRGILTTETTLIKNVNDSETEIEALSKFLNSFKRDASYFMTPIYPTIENYAVSPDEDTLKNISALIKEKIPNSFMLCCPETEEFFATDDFENELLGLLELHPVNVNAVKSYSQINDGDHILNKLLDNKIIEEVIHNGKSFYSLTGISLNSEEY